jgi:hypothetical protein
LPASAGEVSEIRDKEFTGMEETLVLQNAMIHQGHWHALMRLIATQHGTEATIFRQAIKIAGSYYSQESNGKGSRRAFRVLVEYEPVVYGPTGALEKPARIFYRSSGLEAVQRTKLESLLKSPLPGFMGNASAVVSEYRATVPEPPKAQEVFISYAWDYKLPDHEEDAAKKNRIEYAKFVDELESRISTQFPQLVKVVRDRNENKRGDSLPQFMNRIKQCKYAVVVLSDKYLTSWYCMYELDQLMKSLIKKDRGISDVQFIVHPSIPPSLNPDDLTWRDPIDFWEEVLVRLKRAREESRTLQDNNEQKNDRYTVACNPELGINTIARWWRFPGRFGGHIELLPEVLQGLNMHHKLRSMDKEPWKLDPGSITESIDNVIEWMHAREGQDTGER